MKTKVLILNNMLCFTVFKLILYVHVVMKPKTAKYKKNRVKTEVGDV